VILLCGWRRLRAPAVSPAMLRCIYNIPICGGFCAPTENPEESCLRHFSNEYTIPASGVFMKVGSLIEWSTCCRFCGSSGFRSAEKLRSTIMLLAFAVSFFSWILLIYPLLGLSMTPRLIRAGAWAQGSVHIPGRGNPFEVHVGLKGRVDTVDCNAAWNQTLCLENVHRAEALPFVPQGGGVFSRLVPWSKTGSCPDPAGSLATRLRGDVPDTSSASPCQRCRASAAETVTFAIMGAVTQIPQMTTDLQRATRFGDVNCQSTMGFATSLFGCFSALMSLRSFGFSCWKTFPDASVGTDMPLLRMGAGPAFWCLVVASVLKLVDALAHFVVPTPVARRTTPPKGVQDLESYMRLAVADHLTEEETSHSESGTGSGDGESGL